MCIPQEKGNLTTTHESSRVRVGAAEGSLPDPADGEQGPPETRVLVVEDQRALAGALQIAIDAQPDLDCVGAVRTVEEAVTAVTSCSPDVVLMDIRLPGVDGIEGTRQIKKSHPEVRVLILTANATPDLLGKAVAAGAAGFLAKDSAFPLILTAIRAPLGEKILVEGLTLAALVEGLRLSAPAGAGEPDQARLTTRELEVLALLGEGLNPRAIAQRLVVSLHTARGHIKNIMLKLGAHSQLEAVVTATRIGLLPSPPATRETS
ncbi:response regulator transcription factor [Allokutzneria albata]|uniref:DNA-binding response regulator, NarL/FixJ family, contains REC and HTH domains n=1 Tax=Allokutzneria albata TaxID=211114 RepID=A0A1G9SGA2_ALLAB|nr:response regulator transcription factor [Allokutzneria albata]SDM34432.1 DNA-binding response regulator, NarL/FixJ family, contains REC and HTH domains [Allokutzneria albata]